MFFLKKEKASKEKTPIFGEEGGCNITAFYEAVFCKMSKVIVFLVFLCQFLVALQKHYKIRYFSTF